MYTPLYIQTDNTFLTSMIKIDDLINFAKENNIKSLSLCDQNLYGAMEFYQKCIKNDIHPILGLELTIQNEIIILYAKNYEGYKNLMKLSTLSTEREIDYSDLEKYHDNLICITLNEKMYEILKSTFENIYESFSRLEDRDENKIYMRKTLYLKKEDKVYYPYLKAIKLQKIVYSLDKDENDFSLNLDTNYFTKLNYEITKMCNVEFPKPQNYLPIYPCIEGYTSETYLEKLTFESLKNKDLETNQYIERLNYELNVIKKMGFCNYFLIVMDYVNYAKTHDILVGPGRGSASGSLVSYLLGITSIDPLKYHLIFERFLNPERITMPDIDVDFEYTKRENMISYCIQKYGIKRVAPIITFGTMASKQVLRDVGKCMDIDLKIIENVTKKIDTNLSLMENYKQNIEIRKILKESKELFKIYKIALKFEGMKRHSSVHAAGIVMSRVDLDEIIPIDFSHQKYYVTGYSMEYLENLGLLKMDFLALKNLTMIKDIIDDVNVSEHKYLNFDTIPENDQNALSIFENVDTVGIFQFESSGMKSFLQKLKPKNFEEIFSAIALYRPGPMGNINHFIDRKRGKEKVTYYHPDLEEILKPTYGIVIYQEQVMQIAHVLAGYTLGEADLLRRAMSKKKEDVLLKEEHKFIERSIQKGYEKSLAKQIYDLILKFASYGFPRAHAVAYSMISYKMAYLKYYYGTYFYKHLLNMGVANNKLKDYIFECKSKNIVFLKPDINYSDKMYKIEEGKIRFPFLGIKNVGIASVEQILEERKKALFIDIFDFMNRCYGKAVNSEVVLSLIYAGCFDTMNINRNTLISNFNEIVSYIELIHDLGKEYALKPEIENKEEFDELFLMNKEYELFGCYLGNHPVSKYKTKYQTVSLENIQNYFDKIVRVVLYVDSKREIKTKNNEKMCFISGSDEKMQIDVVLFPKIYEVNTDIFKGNVILLEGKVEKRLNKYQLIAYRIKKIN